MQNRATLYYKGSFSAAHFLPNYEGPCHNLHGHSFECEVWLSGPINAESGMVLDFRYIKNIIASLDHGLLNEKLANPTAELVAWWLLHKIPLADKVRVWESDHSYAEVEKTYDDRLRELSTPERERLLQGRW